MHMSTGHIAICITVYYAYRIVGNRRGYDGHQKHTTVIHKTFIAKNFVSCKMMKILRKILLVLIP